LNLTIDHYVEAQRLRSPYLQCRSSSDRYHEQERAFLKLLLRIGRLHIELNKPEYAIQFFLEMLLILGMNSFDDIPAPNMARVDKDLLSNILHISGVIHEQAESYSHAIISYEKSISIKKELVYAEKDNKNLSHEI